MPLKTKEKTSFHYKVQQGQPLQGVTAHHVMSTDINGYSLLHYAVSYSKKDLLRDFLTINGVSIDLQNTQNGETALHLACKEGNLDLVTYLLTNGANTAIRDQKGQPPIFYAAANSKAIKLIEVFLAKDPHALEVTNSLGNTLIAYIVLNYESGSSEEVLSYIATKADQSVMMKLQDEFIKWVAKNYEAEKARVIIDRFNDEFQKTKIQIGGISIKPKELTIY